RLDQYRLYHPDLRPHALVLPRETVSAPTLPLMRRLVARRRPHPAATVVDLGDGAGVRVFGDPDDPAPGPVLLWIHGGGYVFGSATQDDRWCHRIAARTGVLVASPALSTASTRWRPPPPSPGTCAATSCTRSTPWPGRRRPVASRGLARRRSARGRNPRAGCRAHAGSRSAGVASTKTATDTSAAPVSPGAPPAARQAPRRGRPVRRGCPRSALLHRPGARRSRWA